jgi:hypothetical protein
MSRTAFELILLTILLSFAAPMAGQTTVLADSMSAMEKMTRPAGIIFAGTLLRAERLATEGSEPATGLIQFRVDEALRGCVVGETISIREWVGLWESGDRYRHGKRVILFLYPRSEAGLTSPVAGEPGKIEVGTGGEWRLTPKQARYLAANSNASSQSGARPTHGESNNQTARARLRSEIWEGPCVAVGANE